MIYGCGELEKDCIRLAKKDDENVYLARMSDNEGTFRLLVTSVTYNGAEKQITDWCKLHTDSGDELSTLSIYDMESA